MEKFYNYLKDKNIPFMKKDEIKNCFKEFESVWKQRFSFDKVMDTLRKKKLTYMFDNYWAIISDDTIVLFQKFLDFMDIPNYYGLETALYFNKKIWQPPLTYKLLNTEYTKTRISGGVKIEFIKIPENVYNRETLVSDVLRFSDYEKTILDLVFFDSNKTYYPDNISRFNLYLGLFQKYPRVGKKLLERGIIK